MSNTVPKFVLKLAVFVLAVVLVGYAMQPVGECSPGSITKTGMRSDSRERSYKVLKGDTLHDIARKHNIAVRELMEINNLKGSMIRSGDILIIPEKPIAAGHLSRGSVSREELMLLARIIHAEARGESFEGQVAIGAVILNRLASPHFPKTIQDVIFQKNKKVYQFSPVGDGSINMKPDEEAVQAAVQALSGRDPTGGALFFYNPDLSSDQWIRTLPVITRIGNHVFATSS